MEPNQRHHHHQEHHLTSPYYHPFHHHTPTTVSAAPSDNGNFPPPPNDGSSSSYHHSAPSSAPIEPVKRKRGRPRKYDTPAQALAAKKLASSASSSSAREKREQTAAAAAGVSPPSKPGSKKSLSGSSGKSGQSFTPHIVNITPGEVSASAVASAVASMRTVVVCFADADAAAYYVATAGFIGVSRRMRRSDAASDATSCDVAQKIIHFAEQSKHELCILSASGTISEASLSHLATGTSVSYQGQYEILSLSGSYIRGEHGGKTGGLSVCLSSSDGQIVGGGVGGPLKAAGPVQVILGTFQLERKKDGRNGVKGDDASGSGDLLPSSPSGAESLHGYRPVMEPSGRNSNDEHCTMTSGGAHFMMQPPQGMHMTHARPSEWDGAGYDLSVLRGKGSSENGGYE
ncbi:hypothetical protein IGI04_008307 [Brassica rapa subsp. trilocularis]|uniref:AT-hook motif nuclear-localized protein n=1 Tax=Brassica rapa subsp. trilocularis TaxID=1813537 RepID=A0ABQ7NMJ1_BRACM|nr:hypothetical protein IGI04_008307 [Brassica rapa subsp. trilocularis]